MKSNINPEYLIEVRKIYGFWLRQLREEKRLSQKELGEMCGISDTTISKIEAGKWNFSIDFLTVIIQRLDAYLFIVEKDSNDDLAVQMRKRWQMSHQEN